MEDIGDILFYVIAAVIGLVTTLGKKKKKKTGMPLPPEAEPADSQDDSMVFYDEDEAVEYPVGEEDFVIDTIHDKNKVSQGQAYDFKPGQEGQSRESTDELYRDEKISGIAEEEMSKGEISENDSDETEDIISDFDLKKAVIFSEILDRKDY